MNTRTSWSIAIGALAAFAITFTLALLIFPPGKADAARYEHLALLMEEHLATVDNRLQDAERQDSAKLECPLQWVDSPPAGRQRFTIETTVYYAYFDEVRNDWVPTCDPDADYYAITLEGSWPNAPAPISQEVAADRYYRYEPAVSEDQTAGPPDALPGED